VAVIVAYGSMVDRAWQAATKLTAAGTPTAVINARFAKPLDAAMITQAAREHGGLVTVEENARTGGFGELVREALVDADLAALPHTVLSLPDRFIEHGDQDKLLDENGLSVDDIVNAVRNVQKQARNS
jgi:1-deoxy-D-xylulose-5-phosphate synthase